MTLFPWEKLLQAPAGGRGAPRAGARGRWSPRTLTQVERQPRVPEVAPYEVPQIPHCGGKGRVHMHAAAPTQAPGLTPLWDGVSQANLRTATTLQARQPQHSASGTRDGTATLKLTLRPRG